MKEKRKQVTMENKKEYSKDGPNSCPQREIPVAVPILDAASLSSNNVDDGFDWTQNSHLQMSSNEQTRPTHVAIASSSNVVSAINIEDANVIPSYEMASYGSEMSSSGKATRSYVEQEQLRAAMEHANARANDEFWQDEVGRSTLRRIDQENNSILKAANVQAVSREHGGSKIGKPSASRPLLQVAKLDDDDSKDTNTSDENKIKTRSVSGYQIREYDTKEYHVKEYQSNYEYKSIYE